MKRGGAHGFTLGKKHLTLYWGSYRNGYSAELAQTFGSETRGSLETPGGFYEFLRHVGSKDWGISLAGQDALIRAMGKRFKWTAAEVRALLRHGQFTFDERNGNGGECHYENAWLYE